MNQLNARYEAARAQVLLGVAYHQTGDLATGELELQAARRTLEELGAAPDVARVDELLGSPAAGGLHGLTPRELQVLRLIAEGKTNDEIAAALVVSKHTVRRHVQNIFAKVGVSSRSGATAYAFRHGLERARQWYECTTPESSDWSSEAMARTAKPPSVDMSRTQSA